LGVTPHLAQDGVNAILAVYYKYGKSESAEHPMSAYLQRPRLFAGSLDFHKGCTAFRQKHDTVRHPIETRRNEFWSNASHVFYLFNELSLDFFFSHLTSHINHNRHNCTTFPYILLTRVYGHVFYSLL